MSLEAIAAMLGHHSLDMTLRYAKIANRTVAEEYFAVTEQGRRPLRQDPPRCPPTRSARTWPGCAANTTGMLGNGYCTRPPSWTARSSPSARPARFFQTSIEFRPTLQAQHDDARAKQQDHRAAAVRQPAHPRRPGRLMTPARNCA